MTPNSTQKGEITVALVTARFLQLGYTVLRPIGESSRYDLVIDRGSGFERIQCKSGRLRKGSVYFNTYSSSSPYAGGERRHYEGQIDLFAVYCPELKECFLVPISDIARHLGVLRVEAVKVKKTNMRMAVDYVL